MAGGTDLLMKMKLGAISPGLVIGLKKNEGLDKERNLGAVDIEYMPDGKLLPTRHRTGEDARGIWQGKHLEAVK